MKRLRKLKNQAGFSLAELLMTVLILLMVSLIVAIGMPAARNAYEKTVIGANAQAMLSTAVAALRDELGTAWDVQVPNTTTATYFKADTGTMAQISKGEDGSIALKDFVAVDFVHDYSEESTPLGNARHLVPSENTGLYVTYDGIEYDSGIVKISGLMVCRQTDTSGSSPLAKIDGDLEIRVISVKSAI